jgi:hypothetical protein
VTNDVPSTEDDDVKIDFNLIPALLALGCGGIFVLAIVGLGIFLVIQGTQSRRKAGESLTWPSTMGAITETEVRQSRSTDDDGNVDISYYPRVVYTYDVEGQSHRSHRIAFGAVKPGRSAAQAQKTLARYPVGGSVTICYNPNKPSEAVLERTAAHTRALTIIGVVCLALALCIGGALVLGVVANLG